MFYFIFCLLIVLFALFLHEVAFEDTRMSYIIGFMTGISVFIILMIIAYDLCVIEFNI